MGVWSKIGKGLLAASPYIAAPFTGGASLSLAPVARGALNAWNAHDANKAMSQGLAPSRTDQFMGMASDFYGGQGMPSYGGGENSYIRNDVNNSANRASGWQGALNGVLSQDSQGFGRPSVMMDDPSRGGIGGRGPGIDWAGMFGSRSGQQSPGFGGGNSQPSYGGNGYASTGNPWDQTNPNLAFAIDAGRRAGNPNYNSNIFMPAENRKGKQLLGSQY